VVCYFVNCIECCYTYQIKTIYEHGGGTSYFVIWNGTDFNNQPVSPGVYLYQLKAGDKALAQEKMLLLK